MTTNRETTPPTPNAGEPDDLAAKWNAETTAGDGLAQAMKSLRFVANLERDSARLDSVMVANWIIQEIAEREPVCVGQPFGVTGAMDEAEALAVALFDVRCPGIRMTDEDLHYYRAAAERALQAVRDELDTPAAQDDPAKGLEARYLLMKRGLYYAPNAMGYTGIRDKAGRYSEAEARGHADEASGVTATLEADAPLISPKCFDDIARDYLTDKLATAELQIAERDARVAELEATLRYCERQWSVERGTMIDKLADAEADAARVREALWL